MMTAMMDAMIRSMSTEEREDVLLKLMPDMMKQVNVNTLVENMLTAIGKEISLGGAYRFFYIVLKDAELKAEMVNALEDIKTRMSEMMPEMMSMMMPMMMSMMKPVMSKMMSFMMPMMFGMMSQSDGGCTDMMCECTMIEQVKDNPQMKQMMGKMMMQMCPEMASHVITPENSAEFVRKITDAVRGNDTHSETPSTTE